MVTKISGMVIEIDDEATKRISGLAHLRAFPGGNPVKWMTNG